MKSLGMMGIIYFGQGGLAKIANNAVEEAERQDIRLHNWSIDIESGIPRNQIKKQSDILKLLGAWALAKEMVARLEKMTEEKRNAELAKSPDVNFEELQSKINKMSGAIWGTEEVNPELFQEELNLQLKNAIEHWRKIVQDVDRIISYDDPDEPEAKEYPFEKRDTYEFAARAIEVIKLQYPRMKDVDLETFEKGLRELDEPLKKALKGRTRPLAYAPKSFWWRQK